MQARLLSLLLLGCLMAATGQASASIAAYVGTPDAVIQQCQIIRCADCNPWAVGPSGEGIDAAVECIEEVL